MAGRVTFHWTPTFAFYPQQVKNYIQWELGSRALFFITAACALAVMPFEYKIAALVLVLVRYLLVAIQVRQQLPPTKSELALRLVRRIMADIDADRREWEFSALSPEDQQAAL